MEEIERIDDSTIVAVAGDFERAAMIKKLDATLAHWPVPGEPPGRRPLPPKRRAPDGS